MKLPNLSESMYVARLRHIHSIHESSERRGPDTLVRHFIPMRSRWNAAWLNRDELAKLRSEPFYYYLLARTKYYDQVIEDAVANGVKQIVIVGCGSDTRAYRFQDRFRDAGISVLECDQPEAIHIKQQMTKRWRRDSAVEYLAIDLNNDAWPELGKWLSDRSGSKTLVLMEGVSVYVDDRAFAGFLEFLAASLLPGSHVAYDFKIRGCNDGFGQVGRTLRPFRLAADAREVASFHDRLGLQLDHMELSKQLHERLLSGPTPPAPPLFGEDGLLKLHVR
jgi:methyltransferase (TIGR00027 family)